MSLDDFPNDGGAMRWRGVHVDTCRHFLPLREIRRLVEAMPLLHLNILHIHLTDDQGWRFESKKWPKLTSVGAWRSETVVNRPAFHVDRDLYAESYRDKFDGKRHGGFYTQDELRELVAFAKTKGIIVVPEIEMPGHMRAARAAYPELGYNGKVVEVGRSWGIYHEVLRVDEPGLAFCRDILEEVCDVFPSPFIHIGGDECPKAEWRESRQARKQLEDLGETDNFEVLQRWFTGQIAEFLASKGRRLLGWDEIIDGGKPAGDPVVFAWRNWLDAAPRAIKMGIPVVQTPDILYFDYAQGPEEDEPLALGEGGDLRTVYAYDPYKGIDPADRKFIVGLQCQHWAEYIPNADHLWYMAFPRLIAAADVAWLGDKRPPYDEFVAGLPARLKELEKLGISHHPLPPPEIPPKDKPNPWH